VELLHVASFVAHQPYQESDLEPGMVVHTQKPITQEAEAEGSLVQGQSELQREILRQLWVFFFLSSLSLQVLGLFKDQLHLMKPAPSAPASLDFLSIGL
jgi:hypothetical protein